jgi:hypothetical protein
MVVGLLIPAEENDDEATSATTAATTAETPPATVVTPAPVATPAPAATTAPAAPTPKERVEEAVGDEVDAEGYAGTLDVQDVSFDGTEAQVTVATPEGGFEGASCGDLDDGARAVFETIYNDAGWEGGAVTVFKGGLVDTSTGQELPDVNTGIYTMPAAQARQIDWSNEDALLNINWSLYRDYCHQALKD